MRAVGPRSAWRALAREPLVHFVALGLVLFAVEGWRARPRPTAAPPPPPPAATGAPGPTARAPIVIDPRAAAQIRAQAERQLGRRPTPVEVEAATERWIDEEVLYREALARGLERDDPMIHQRIASRMSYVLEQAVLVPEPSVAELRAWFERHRERWTVPARVDFSHVFVAGTDAAAQARATALVAQLAGGAAPAHLGDRFAGGHRYRGRRLEDLAATFGDEFVAGLAAQVVGRWQPRRSRFGLHVVRLDRVTPSQPADFAAARLDVRKAWREARRETEVGAARARLRAGWEVVRR